MRIFIFCLSLLLFFSCKSDDNGVVLETPEEMVIEQREAVVKSTTELGPIKAPDNVLARDAGISAVVGNSILWLFGDTLFSPTSEDGTNLRSNTAAIAPITTPTQTAEPTDATGAPFQSIPFTDAENTYNTGTGSANERIALWPGGLMPESTGALAFVHKLFVNPGVLNYEHIGVEMADFSTGSTTAVRSGTLFETDDPIFLSPMEQENFIYLYGLININGSQGVGVARAPKAMVREKSAYEAWNGSNWNSDLSQTATLFSSVPGAVSVSYNAYLNRYIAVHSFTLSNRVVLRTSDTPEGNWSEPITLFEGEVPETGFNYAGEQHPELGEQNGKVIYVSYYHPKPGLFDGELRLVKVEFE